MRPRTPAVARPSFRDALTTDLNGQGQLLELRGTRNCHHRLAIQILLPIVRLSIIDRYAKLDRASNHIEYLFTRSIRTNLHLEIYKKSGERRHLFLMCNGIPIE